MLKGAQQHWVQSGENCEDLIAVGSMPLSRRYLQPPAFRSVRLFRG